MRPSRAQPPVRATSRQDRELCVARRQNAPDLGHGQASSGVLHAGHTRAGSTTPMDEAARASSHPPYPEPGAAAETTDENDADPAGGDHAGLSKPNGM
jgi:hypothetical protein